MSLENLNNMISMKQRVSGRYKLMRVKAESRAVVEETPWIVEETPWCKNLLTYPFFNNAFTGNSYLKGCVVGAGTSAPAESDTSLASYLASTTDQQSLTTTRNYTVSPRYVSYAVRFRFGEGVAAGNVSEVGIVTSSTAGSITINSGTQISSRARVTDEHGNPTSITVLPDEFLDVVWELYVYAHEDVAGTVSLDINGVPTNFDFTMRSIGMNTTQYWYGGPTSTSNTGGRLPDGRLAVGTGTGLGSACVIVEDTSLIAYDGTPTRMSGSTGNFTTKVDAPYTSNSKELSTVIRVPLNNGNIAAPGFRSVILQQHHAAHQILFDDYILKSNLEVFELDFTIQWGNV